MYARISSKTNLNFIYLFLVSIPFVFLNNEDPFKLRGHIGSSTRSVDYNCIYVTVCICGFLVVGLKHKNV